MDKLTLLENRIKALEQEIKNLKMQQLRNPIDTVSKALIREKLPVYKSKTTGSTAVGGYITVEIDGLTYNLLIK